MSDVASSIAEPGWTLAGKHFARAGRQPSTDGDVNPFWIALHKQIVYALPVIRSFANKEAESLFATEQSRRLPPSIRRRAMVRLNQLDHATTLDDLRFPPSNRLELLKGDRAGQWSPRINDQWRICFRFEGGNAFAVEIVDYH